ncbi:MAG: hypothetical protein Q4C56_04800 [Peptococcaceae bacterium]|nr:hypothetical protein [Peptococcaceae bacterium]
MLGAKIWYLAFFALLTGLAVPLLGRKQVVVPLVLPLAFLLAEIGVVQWCIQGGWTTAVYGQWLAGFVLVGCALIWQSFGRRRCYLFRGGSFYRDLDAYETVARAIVETLQSERLAPAAVILRYEGVLLLEPMRAESQAALFKHLADALDDSRWRRWGTWQAFFGAQWLAMVLWLVLAFFGRGGGI